MVSMKEEPSQCKVDDATTNSNKTKSIPSSALMPVYDDLLCACLGMISTSVQSRDQRATLRALRCLKQLRKNCDVGILHEYHCKLNASYSNDVACEVDSNVVNMLNDSIKSLEPFHLPSEPFAEDKMDVVIDDPVEVPDAPQKMEACLSKLKMSGARPEAAGFLVMLAALWHLDSHRLKEASDLSTRACSTLISLNRRTLDYISARAMFYYYLAHEKAGDVRMLRQPLLSTLRTASLHNDSMTQATVLNLILRNCLHFKHYDLALKIVSKTSYPEALQSSTQYIRYLFYLGQIHAMQLEYTEAHTRIMQALRKAPQTGPVGKGFRLIATKMAIVVELLLGEIPDRQIFNQKDIRDSLSPYQQIVQAVRGGDLNTFKQVTSTHNELFSNDRTLALIRRLHHSVIRAGLRMINIAFSKISLRDIAEKLGLENESDAEYVVSKAILDNVIEATINPDGKYVESQPKADLYNTTEPSKAFHKRIAFCLQLHSDAVKAMHYPEDNEYKGEDPEARKRLQEELASVRSNVMDLI